jgi:hypothetical protein
LTDVHHNPLRRQRNEFDCRDQTGIDLLRIFRLDAARNSNGEFTIRRDIANLLEILGLLRRDQLREGRQANKQSR